MTKNPKRTSIPKLINVEDLNLETALSLLSLPRDLGKPPGKINQFMLGLEDLVPIYDLAQLMSLFHMIIQCLQLD